MVAKAEVEAPKSQAVKVVEPKVEPAKMEKKAVKKEAKVVEKVAEKVKEEPKEEPKEEVKDETPTSTFLSGPRPKGKKKFKQIAVEEPKVQPDDMSDSQKRKQELKKKKMDDEFAAKKEAERLRKQKEDDRKAAETKRYEEEQHRLTKEMFENLAAAQKATAS